MDWAHDDFKEVYLVPGEQNLFNDFHSREWAPTGSEFYTLKQHAENVERKVAAMHATVEAALPLPGLATKTATTRLSAGGRGTDN